MPHFTHESSGELPKKKLTCMKVAANCYAACNRARTGRAALHAAERDAGPSLLATPHANAKALGAAAEHESQYQQYPGGDHEHNGRCGAIAVVLLEQQQKVVAAVAAAGGVAEVRCVADVDIGQRGVAAAHHVENGLQLGDAQECEI